VDPRAGLDDVEKGKFMTLSGLQLDPSVVQPVAIPTELSRLLFRKVQDLHRNSVLDITCDTLFSETYGRNTVHADEYAASCAPDADEIAWKSSSEVSITAQFKRKIGTRRQTSLKLPSITFH
jgi:hypothetical protein